MPLAPGYKLGPYEIVSPLGSGGMGEVYRARDTRLERTVAVKILPSHLASDAILRQRLEREAKTISSLNHPHVCVLHDIGHQDGIDFLVMEFLEGETLERRLEKGPLPVDQVVKIGAEIADAIDRAHRSGLVHRDLKPGNIMLTSMGAKLMDFGLAKPGVALARGATLTASAKNSPVTEEGMIVGTFQYMSPEQVEGKEVDGRSDIFSLGSMFYEMVTGKRAFEGRSRLSVASAILEKEPEPISTIKPLTPLALDHVVRRCLAKDPEERWQTGRDVALELKWAGRTEQVSVGQENASARLIRRSRLVWALALGSLGVTAVAVRTLWHSSRPIASPVAHLTMEIAPAKTLGPARFFSRPTYTAIAISPDGSTVVFSGVHGSLIPPQTQLYKRTFEQNDVTAIPGTDGAAEPFFSPDGQWVAFFAAGKLKKVPINGGPPVTICDFPDRLRFGGTWGASWDSTDNIVFALRIGGLMQVSAAGGQPHVLVKHDPQKPFGNYATPQFLPDGQTVLFTVRSSDDWDEAEIVAMRLGTGEQHTVIKGGADAHYVPTGHLVYMKNGVLMAVPFDAQRVQLAGSPVAMVDGVMQSVNMKNELVETGMGQFAISSSGNLVYASGGISPATTTALVRVNRRGMATKLNAPKSHYLYPRLSPDGRRIAVIEQEETSRSSDVWVVDVNSGNSTRLTMQRTNFFVLWSPDGKRILFSGGPGLSHLLSVAADGSGIIEPVAAGRTLTVPASWSRDGKWLAYIESHDGESQLWIRPMADPAESRRFVESNFNLIDADFSPDGRWLTYTSNESGASEVYVQAFPGPGEKHRISTAGGGNPAWARGGHELFYLQPGVNGKTVMMAVDIAPGDTFRASAPHALFEGPWAIVGPLRGYDVTPDGQQFIMLREEETPDQPVTKLNVVINWFEELRRRVPTTIK